jgi:uncharacterized repeat protein (TIGR01451 family)
VSRENSRPAPVTSALHWVARAGVRAGKVVLLAAAAWCASATTSPGTRAATTPGTTIANTARVSWTSDAIPPSAPSSRDSNTVVTSVAPLVTFDPFRIDVDPQGVVAPGTDLTYTITATNRSGIDLPGVVVRLPLDAQLAEPRFVSATAGGVALAGVAVAYDSGSGELVWTLSDVVRAGQTLVLVCRARVAVSTPAGALVTEQARQTTALSIAEGRSNTVVTPVLPPLLRLTILADRPTVVPGDGVGFVLTVEHIGTDLPLHAVQIANLLPPELRYVAGTARIDGIAAPDPAVDPDGRTMRIGVPDLAPGEKHVVRIGARAAPTAREGDLLDHGFAIALTPTGLAATSPPASATVRLVPGPFKQEATLVGRVFVDDDGDGRPGPDESGVPGVLVVLEDGRGAVTDVTGRWHVEGVRPGLHVARIDPGTLPAPLAARIGGADWAGGSASRFVEARVAGLVVVDLPVGPPHAPRCSIGSPRGTISVPAASLGGSGDASGPRAAGVLDAAAAYLVDLGEIAPRVVTAACDDPALDARAIEAALRRRVAERAAVVEAPAATPDAAAVEAPKDPLEELVRTAAPVASIAYPAEGARAARGSTNVEVVYPMGSRLDLMVNGEILPMDLVGATSSLPSRHLSASRFVGVKLREGENVIALRATPPGADPASITPVRVRVVRPGPTVALAIGPVESRCVADGVTPCVVRVEALDEGGMRAGDEPIVTLTVEGARPLDPDADPRTVGHQVRLVEGRALVHLAPPASPGRIRVFAQIERATAERFLEVLPSGGAWRVMGLAEGHAAGPAGVEGDGGLPPGILDDRTESGGRLSVLAQGPVLDQSHLTVSIDTDRKRDPYRLFDRFRPDAFFPAFGDSGGGADLAARQGPVYVRLDGPSGFVAVGDFATAFTHTELARFDRRLEGAWGRAGNAKVAVDAFVSPTDQSAIRDIFAPDGTSGPYLLGHRPVIAYSESVILEVRDRFHPEDVVRRIVKLPDLDYALDTEAGTILFRAPVAPFDADLDPVRIVVLYEARDGSSRRVTAGARVVGHPVPQVDAGATAVVEGHDGGNLELYGVDVVWRAKPGTTLAAEAAASREGGATQIAYRAEAVSQSTDALRWDLHYHDIPAGFANPSLLSAPEIGGRRASGAVQWQSHGPWRIRAEALWQNDTVNDASRTVGAVVAERRAERVTLTGGLRGVASDDASGRIDSALAEVGVRARISPRWTAELFRAQVLTHDVAPGYPNRTSLGVAWQIKDGRRLVLKQEYESGGSFGNHARTLLGLESRLGAHTRALVNYTLEGGDAGTALRSSSGIETVLPLSSKTSLSASAAVVDTTRGDGSADFVALAGGYEYRAGSSLVSARYEVNFNPVDVRHLVTASGVFRAGPPWTVFVREQVFVSDPRDGPVSARTEGLFGAAYRPASGPFQFLARLDHTIAGGPTPSTTGGVTPGGVVSQPAGSISTPAVQPGAPGLGTDYARAGPLATRDSVALNFAAGFRIDPRNRLASTLVFRRVGAEADTGIPGSSTWLVSLHYTAQFAERWTLGASLRRFAQRESGTTSYGHGIEVGYLAIKNLWVTGGYNFAGFQDRDFPSAERTDRGAFVSLRFKFDEKSLASIKDLRLDR